MKAVKLSELPDEVRLFFEGIQSGDVVTVEDEQGRSRFSIAALFRASDEERAAALSRLRQLQEKTRQAMQASGVTEEDVDRVLQEDD